jgi:hypothetical protein
MPRAGLSPSKTPHVGATASEVEDSLLDLFGVPRDRRGWTYPATVAILAMAGARSRGGMRRGPIICPFRRITGLPCPGCGLTRSFVSTANLRPDEGFAYHLFGPILFAAMLGWVAWRTADFLGLRKRLPVKAETVRQAATVALALWLGWSGWRLLRALGRGGRGKWA